jgi:hypothetical protein
MSGRPMVHTRPDRYITALNFVVAPGQQQATALICGADEAMQALPCLFCHASGGACVTPGTPSPGEVTERCYQSPRQAPVGLQSTLPVRLLHLV